MKSAVIKAGPTVKIIDVPVPEPGPGQILVKVVVAGTNPKDWKTPEVAATGAKIFAGIPIDHVGEWSNQGDDLAGYVEKVGQGVVGFKPGDRVAALHQCARPNGAWAEYSIAESSVTWHIPENISFEEAATVPLTALTAAISLFFNHRLPTPLAPATEQIPLIVNGASTAVGAFVVKLAVESNIHPIIATAGGSCEYVRTLIDPSKGDAVIDYRQDHTKLVAQLKGAIKKAGADKARHAFEAIGSQKNVDLLREVLAEDGHIDFVLPLDVDTGSLKKTCSFVEQTLAPVDGVEARSLGYMVSKWFTYALAAGRFTGHPFEVRKGGLYALEAALTDIKNGKNSGLKYIVRVGETEGIFV